MIWFLWLTDHEDVLRAAVTILVLICLWMPRGWHLRSDN